MQARLSAAGQPIRRPSTGLDSQPLGRPADGQFAGHQVRIAKASPLTKPDAQAHQHPVGIPSAARHPRILPPAAAETPLAFVRALAKRWSDGNGRNLPAPGELMAGVHQAFGRRGPRARPLCEMEVGELFGPVAGLAAHWPLTEVAALVLGLRVHLEGAPAANRIARQVLERAIEAFARSLPVDQPERLQRVASCQARLEGLLPQLRERLADPDCAAIRESAGCAAEDLLMEAIAQLSESLPEGDTATPASGPALRARVDKLQSQLRPDDSRFEHVRAGALLALSLAGRHDQRTAVDVVRAWAEHRHPGPDDGGEAEIARRAAFMRGFLLASTGDFDLPQLLRAVLRREPAAPDDLAWPLSASELIEAMGLAVGVDHAPEAEFAEWLKAWLPNGEQDISAEEQAAAIEATARLAKGAQMSPQRLERVLGALIDGLGERAAGAGSLRALAAGCGAAEADPLDSLVLQRMVAYLCSDRVDLAPAFAARLAWSLVPVADPAQALRWLLRAARGLAPAPMARWLEGLLRHEPGGGRALRMSGWLAAVADPAVGALPWQRSFMVFCLDRALAGRSWHQDRRELTDLCLPRPGPRPAAGDWRDAAWRGLRMSRDPLAVLGDAGLPVPERATLLGAVYALPGELTPPRADAHVRQLIAQGLDERGMALLEPLLRHGPQRVPLRSLVVLREHAAALLARQPVELELAAPWRVPPLSEGLGRFYRAVLEARLEEALAPPATKARQSLAEFVAAEGEAVAGEAVPAELRGALQPVLAEVRDELAGLPQPFSPLVTKGGWL